MSSNTQTTAQNTERARKLAKQALTWINTPEGIETLEAAVERMVSEDNIFSDQRIDEFDGLNILVLASLIFYG